MSTNIVNQVAFLRTSRSFPEESQPLSVEIDRAYIDIANSVNTRIIGIFSTNRSSQTGESWWINKNQRQQTLRQVYLFTSTSAIDHNINVLDPNQFTRCWGSYTEGTNSFGLIWGTSVAINGQISFYVTSTQIVFVLGSGAPVLTNGKITLEWLSSP